MDTEKVKENAAKDSGEKSEKKKVSMAETTLKPLLITIAVAAISVVCGIKVGITDSRILNVQLWLCIMLGAMMLMQAVSDAKALMLKKKTKEKVKQERKTFYLHLLSGVALVYLPYILTKYVS